MRSQKKFVLYGLGGSGKTQVCLKFAENNQERFWGVFWVDASSDVTAKQSFVEIAKIGGVEETYDSGRQWLTNRTEEWLLIIDNADDPLLHISNYIPAGNRGFVLVTTRNPYNADDGPSYEFKGMGMQDSITLLLKAAGEDKSNLASCSQAEAIAKELGCLALALSQAGATIRQKASYLNTYLADYSQIHKELMISHPVQGADGYKYTVYTTWEISRKKIETMTTEEAADAVDLLEISAYLHPEDIPKEIFIGAPTKQDRGMVRRALNLLKFSSSRGAPGPNIYRVRNALSLLSKYSLITFGESKDSFSMHRLVHSWIRDRLNERDKLWCIESAVTVLKDSILWQWKASDYILRRRLLAHVDFHLYNDNPKSKFLLNGNLNVNQAQIAAKFALVYSENGKYEKAENLYQRALDGMNKALRKDSLETLRIINNLSLVLESQGKYDAASEMVQRPLKISFNISDDDHPDMIESVHNLALILQSQGKYNEAEEKSREALERRERLLGKEDAKTLESLSNLAWVLGKQGKYEEAEEMNQRALARRERVLGSAHPDTLTSINNLASVLESLGEYERAEEMNRKALKNYEQALGAQHPHTLTSVSNLAETLRKRENYREAEELNQRALTGRQKELGSNHPDTLASMTNIAVLLKSQGRYTSAEDMYRQAIKGYEVGLGAQHPDTLLCVRNAAWMLQSQGKFDDAEVLNRRAVEGFEDKLGPQHLETLTSIFHLAYLFHTKKEYEKAFLLYDKACKGFDKLDLSPTAKSCSNSFVRLRNEMKLHDLSEQQTNHLPNSSEESGDVSRVEQEHTPPGSETEPAHDSKGSDEFPNSSPVSDKRKRSPSPSSSNYIYDSDAKKQKTIKSG